MSQSEIDIIRMLSSQAAEPHFDFAESLRSRLLERERELNNYQPVRRNVMKFTLLVGLCSLVIIAGSLTIFLLGKDDEPIQSTQTPTPNTATSLGSSLPNQQAQSLDEAKKSLSFVPSQPSVKINNETLSNIKVGIKNNMIDDSDTLYLTYSDSTGTLYKVSETTKPGNYPSETEVVSLTLNGNEIAAWYYEIPEFEAGEGAISSSDATSPRSYIFWTVGEVTYEISEFGRVSRQQLIELAQSL